MLNISISKEKKIIKNFLKNGYIIFDIEDKKKLNSIKTILTQQIKSKLKLKKSFAKKNIFDTFHNHIDIKNLNEIRMSIYSSLNSKKDFLKNYYCLAEKHLEIICGNELAMQRKINLSIQLPKDNSSLLPIHSDVWSGCSPFEVVLWVPLVDVYNSKSMFIFPKNINDKVYKKFSLYKNSQILFDNYKNKIKFLNLKFGQGIIFAHSIIHGNIVNNTNETRWSFNCRFKSLMSPYYKKDIAETFIPISIKPATNIGLEYEHPKI